MSNESSLEQNRVSAAKKFRGLLAPSTDQTWTVQSIVEIKTGEYTGVINIMLCTMYN